MPSEPKAQPLPAGVREASSPATGLVTGTVGWDDAVADWAGFPRLDGDTAADACVVGLGASGLAAIDALTARGLSVVGVDAGRVAAGAAGRNGGFLIAGPEPPLHEAIARWGLCAVDLYRATLAELDRIAARLGPDVVRRVGSIRLAGLPGPATSDEEAADRDAELADCAAQAATLREHGIAVEEYAGPLGRGLFLPGDAATNPAVRATRLAQLLAPQTHLHEHTTVVDVAAGRVTTERGIVSAPTVIVAVDGRLDVLLPRLIGRVRTARLQMLATEPMPARIPCPVYGRWGYDYAQQLPDGRLFVGGGRDRFVEAEWTHEATPSPPVQAYIETVAERMAGRPVRVTDRWAASVGFTPDARPLCTVVDDGVVAIGGYNGTGNLVGPVAARAAVALALEGVAPPPYLAT
ncbi:MAG: gamma-glutamylputrescine oxidase [Pseudonocardiales bacterium]|nr:gamma-glutamylputrescine oxidase [Pseudonocardiales bacterium]